MVIYGVIFVYYLIATVFPIDKIIGRIYPVFGAILLFSAIGVFIGVFALGFPLTEIWEDWNAGSVLYGTYFSENHFIRSSSSRWPAASSPDSTPPRRRSSPVR